MSVFEFEGKEIRPDARAYMGYIGLRYCHGPKCPQSTAYTTIDAPHHCEIMQRSVDVLEVCPPWAILMSRRVEELTREKEQQVVPVTEERLADVEKRVERLEQRVEKHSSTVRNLDRHSHFGSLPVLNGPVPSIMLVEIGPPVIKGEGNQQSHPPEKLVAFDAVIAYFRGKKTPAGDRQAELLEEAARDIAEIRNRD